MIKTRPLTDAEVAAALHALEMRLLVDEMVAREKVLAELATWTKVRFPNLLADLAA